MQEWSRRELLRRLGRAAALAGVAGGTLPLWACAAPQSPAARASGEPTLTPVKGGTVIEGNIVPVNDFSPVNRSGTAVHINLTMLLECLYGPTASSELEPRIAEALPTISADGFTYTIPLRKNAVWSDGRPVTADDVLFTYGLILDPQYRSIPSSVRASFLDLVASLQATDPTTVVFRLKTPDAPFVTRLLDVDIAPKHVLGAMSAAQIQASFSKPPDVVNGVWKVVDWKSGDFIKYTRNESYYDGPALLDGYVYKAVPQTQNLVNQLKTGEVDCARVAAPAVFDELKASPNIGLALIPASFAHGYSYNLDPAKPSSKVLGSKAVRQALLLALDREAIAKSVFFGYAQVQDSTHVPGSWAYSDPKVRYAFDPKRAAAMLEAEGWKMGSAGIREKNGVPLKLEITATQGVPDSPVMAEVMQQSWKRIGADASVRAVPQPAWVQSTRFDRNFDVIYNTFSQNIDPDQSSAFHSRNAVVGGSNAAIYINAEVDKLVDQASAATDRATRKRLYAQIQDIVLDELPVAPVVLQQYGWAYNTRVRGMGEKEIGIFNIGGPRSKLNKVFVTR